MQLRFNDELQDAHEAAADEGIPQSALVKYKIKSYLLLESLTDNS